MLFFLLSCRQDTQTIEISASGAHFISAPKEADEARRKLRHRRNDSESLPRTYIRAKRQVNAYGIAKVRKELQYSKVVKNYLECDFEPTRATGQRLHKKAALMPVVRTDAAYLQHAHPAAGKGKRPHSLATLCRCAR